ncbi:MAG: hypothetical protein KAS72_02145 [Phycisphaerales bacterium]|nr:hypothetical protein [Phycisphaerales bacterium]
MRHPFAMLLAVLVALTLPAQAGLGQPSDDTIELAPPYTVRPNGLSLRPPIGTELRVVGTGNTARLTMIDGRHLWRMELTLVQTASPDDTPADVMQDRITVLAPHITVREHRRHLLINGRLAERAFVDGYEINGTPAVVGLAVVAVAPQRFGVLQIVTLPAEYEKSKMVFEVVSDTLDYADPADQEQVRRRLARQGQALLDDRMGELLASLEPTEQWYRLHVTDAAGEAAEVGYVRVQIQPGMRGDVTGKPRATYTPAELAAGYTVHVAARYLPTTAGVYDVVSVFFLSEDRNEEDWKVVGTERRGAEKRTHSLVGTRVGNRLTLRGESLSRHDRPKNISVPSRGYLSQAELYLLPQLLPGSDQPVEVGFWFFNWEREDIAFRTDRTEPHATRAGTWLAETAIPGQDQQTRTILDADGTILERTTSGGVHWEPIELTALRKLWDAKGLPTGPIE